MADNEKKYIEWYKSGFRKFEENLNGQASSKIHTLRKNAITSFVKNGFPTTKNEEWKYTNVDSISNTEFNLEIPQVTIQRSDIEKFFIKNFDCHKIVFINGKLDNKLSDEFNSGNDFFISDLNDYINNNLNSDSAFMPDFSESGKDAFVELNTAFLQNGIVIKIKKDRVVKKPFFLLFIDSGESENYLSQPRIVIEADVNSKVQVIESFQSLNSNTCLNNVVSEYHVKENARIEHIKIQNQAASTFHISNMFSKLEKNSYFKTLDINIGGNITRNNIYAKLAGEGAESILNGIYAGSGKQHIDNRTVIEHVKPNCQSTEIYKGIVGDNARGVFNGKIHVYPDAQKTNAIQNNSGLLLSDNAIIDTKPQLEIYADDVRCTHGATIGQLDDDALFYLRSRAIGLQQAKKMLVNAFAGEVVDEIENENLRLGIQEYINDKLKLIS